MYSSDDVDEDVFYTFSEGLPLFGGCMVVALTVGAASFCGLTIAKAMLSPFVRMSRWRPTSSSARSSDGLSLLPFGSQRLHAPGACTRTGATFSGAAEEPATMRRAA
jgi:hypothetical protein